MKLFKEHQYLLMRRESRDVLGRRAINLWLLVMVLTATFFAISFSAGSMAYLDEKMNDPFTYWLNVYRESPSTNLRQVADGLEKDSLKRRFLYDGVQTEISSSFDFFSIQDKFQLFKIQFYEDMSSDLIAKVLEDDNVLSFKGKRIAIDIDSIHERSLGVIMTMDALRRLGYNINNEKLPAFVDCRVPAKNADTLGFRVYDGFLRAPIPLLAVVRRLPMNKDVIASKYLNIQYTDNYHPEPFNLSKENYARRLYFFVPQGVTDFDEGALQCIPDSIRHNATVKITEERIQERLCSWRSGCVKTVYPDGRPPIHVINEIEKGILKKYGLLGVTRVYDYDESLRERDGELGIDNGLSIRFNKLDSIRSFEQYMKDNYQLQIEMSQVNSKENFNAVSTMANILTFALLLFSIMSIVIFIVNMMQSYFQKVRKNLGTFKAFGISTRELTKSYIAIIVAIVIAALAIALTFTGTVELLLRVLGIMKDGTYSWLMLLNTNTLLAIVVIIISTIVSILIVMRRLLRQTPGDLIYDR